MPKGLREKLLVAFSLMSVLPLLVMGYVLSNYVFPYLKTFGDISLVVGVAIFLALLGFGVARSLVLPVIRLASQAQAIAAGDLERKVEVEESGELGDLGMALNSMTSRVRENMAQLKVYGEQAKSLNLEINHRVLALSHLLQASNLINQAAKLEEIRAFILEKLSNLDEAELNCLLESTGEGGTFTFQAASSADQTRADNLLLQRGFSCPWLARVLKERRFLVVDDRTSSSEEREFLQKQFGMANAVIQPLTCMGKPVGLLLSANRKEAFTFEEDGLNLLKVFARQMAIAIENDFLTKRAAQLEVTDELTGLFNARHLQTRLEEEVQRAIRFHRSCSLLLVRLESLDRVRQQYGQPAADEILKQTAQLLKQGLTDVDRAGRSGPEEFALILPERNKREVMEMAESIRQQIEGRAFTYGGRRIQGSMTVRTGISENPLDGMTGAQLLAKAVQILGAPTPSHPSGSGKERISTGI